ncbi:UDP-glycosyltransferase UGT5-like [Anopheles bellator]|uniref:UDP-glycosyltransferase UGT5-like n=1 Tax=Anopheles bellator TaxID=139047 RepID=UPI002648678C|nr:UDP-glycosyltransferase UGT5-like [Anopheles bellator]
MKWTTLLLLLVLLPARHGEAANILLVSVFPGVSHWLMFEHIIGELLQRGHTVTAITSYRLRGVEPNRTDPGYREVLIDPIYDFESNGLPMEVFFRSQSFSNPFFKMSILWKLGLETTEHAFESPIVQKFLQTKGLHFDLLIAEQFVQESFLMLAHQYRVPIVTINTLGHADYIDRAFGLITPWSFVPHFMLQYGDQMTIAERAYNVMLSAWGAFHRKFYYLPAHTALAEKHLGHLQATTGGSLPSLEDLERNVSLVLVNNHIVSSRPRPHMDGMIDIAGLHIRQPKQLPATVKTFLDEATRGVVYINFGTFMRSSGMPEETLQVFLTVFRNLPHARFLWKWEAETAPANLPPNVLLQKWLPQNDVLAHRNVRLFVSHGGLFGTQEAIYWARPMLFVPFYGDQHSNALKFEQAGLGLTLRIINVTVSELESKIERITGEPSFQRNADRLSAIFRDNPTDPLRAALFWIEYVLRHRGARHLKSAAVQLPWYKYLLLDLLAAMLLVLGMVVWMLKRLLSYLARLFVSRRSDKVKVN